jgi:hypothetical protein
MLGAAAIRNLCVFAALALCAGLAPTPAHALDKVDTYICPTKFGGTGIECFLEAVPQTYTMCRHIKHIEIIEFGLTGAQEGVNGAKTEYCIEKHKLSITRPYQAALREAARNKDEVQGLRKLYDTWLESLTKLVPEAGESNDAYLKRVSQPYSVFNEQITVIRTLDKEAAAPAAKPAPEAASKKKTKSQ